MESMPAFRFVMKRRLTKGDCAIFHASAWSRPPPSPSRRIFTRLFYRTVYSSVSPRVKVENRNLLAKNTTIYGSIFSSCLRGECVGMRKLAHRFRYGFDNARIKKVRDDTISGRLRD